MYGSSDTDEVKNRANILDVVSRYVALKRAGSTWKGLCPFHNEKTPSFNVNPDTGWWRCYGTCSEGGDVIKFVMKIENLSFREALERLANQYNVTLTQKPGMDAVQVQAQASIKDRAFAACAMASRFYRETLANSEDARKYLSARGYGHEILDEFKVGFAGADWEALPRYLARNGIALDDAVTAGVVLTKEAGKYYDKFGERIIFPILDVQDRTIGFGGRLMETIEGRPKYINSAETPIFVKSRQLYGLWKARKAISDNGQAIIVEGYLDVIACHQAGIQNAIASLGTAFTEDHASILSRLAQRVVLAFDADAAGIKAAHKAAAIFAPREIDVRMLALPEGEDPDSMLRAGKEIELNRAIQTALPVTEFHLRQLVAQGTAHGVTDSDREHLLRREALPILRSISSVVERERYIRVCAPLHPHFSAGSAYAEEQIRQELDGRTQRPAAPGGDRPRFSGKGGLQKWRPGQYGASAAAPQTPMPPPPNIREAFAQVFRTVVLGPDDLRAFALTEIKPDEVVAPLRPVWEELLAGGQPVEVLERFSAENEEISYLLGTIMVAPDSDAISISEEGLRGCVAYIHQQHLDEHENRLKIGMQAGDLNAVAEYQALKKQHKRVA